MTLDDLERQVCVISVIGLYATLGYLVVKTCALLIAAALFSALAELYLLLKGTNCPLHDSEPSTCQVIYGRNDQDWGKNIQEAKCQSGETFINRFLAHYEMEWLMSSCGVRRPSVRMSVRL